MCKSLRNTVVDLLFLGCYEHEKQHHAKHEKQHHAIRHSVTSRAAGRTKDRIQLLFNMKITIKSQEREGVSTRNIVSLSIRNNLPMEIRPGHCEQL
jgi:hypothetical protein